MKMTLCLKNISSLLIIYILLQVVSSASTNLNKYVLSSPSDDFQILGLYQRTEKTFTQGLYFDPRHQKLVESGGLYKESKVQMLEIDEEEEVVRTVEQSAYPDRFFGEGLTPFDDTRYISLTWEEKTYILWDRESLELLEERPFPPGVRAGWGLTHSDSHLIWNDGTERLFWLKKDGDMSEFERIDVVKDPQSGRAVRMLNEMDYVVSPETGRHWIFTNKFMSNQVLLIDAETALVEKVFDFSVLQQIEITREKESNPRLSNYDKFNFVLNGIAYDPSKDVFYLTGKSWNFIYRVKIFWTF